MGRLKTRFERMGELDVIVPKPEQYLRSFNVFIHKEDDGRFQLVVPRLVQSLIDGN